MSLGLLFNHQYTQSKGIDKRPLSEMNTASPLYVIKNTLDGSKEARYHVNLVHLLDLAFINGHLSMLSIEQERFISMYFKEAGIATDLINGGSDEPYTNMEIVMKQLDSFLGSYIGELNGKYIG